MPRPRPPHLLRQVSRHGKPVWYVRIGHGPRVRIKSEYGTDDFQREYQVAVAQALPAKAPKVAGVGSLTWAIDQYRLSSAWLALSPATRRQRENIFRHVVKSAGNEKLTDIGRKHIVAGRERRAATPFAARHFLDAMRGLFAWAVEKELATSNPTDGVKVAKPKTEGFKPWTDDDLKKYRDRWPEGTRERHALELILATGLRRGDAVTVGKQHVKDGMVRIKTEKKGVVAYVPLEAEAVSGLTGGPTGDLALIVGKRGKPLKKESFGNWFRKACRAAGVEKRAHGLRKLAASRDAEDGWTESELKAKYGWTDSKMPSHYTREANREKAAKNAAERTKRKNESGESIPSPIREKSLT